MLWFYYLLFYFLLLAFFFLLFARKMGAVVLLPALLLFAFGFCSKIWLSPHEIRSQSLKNAFLTRFPCKVPISGHHFSGLCRGRSQVSLPAPLSYYKGSGHSRLELRVELRVESSIVNDTHTYSHSYSYSYSLSTAQVRAAVSPWLLGQGVGVTYDSDPSVGGARCLEHPSVRRRHSLSKGSADGGGGDIRPWGLFGGRGDFFFNFF